MRFIILFVLFNMTLCFAENNLPLNLLKLPPGFSISIYAYPVVDARQMALGPNVVFVGSIEAGKVYAIIPDSESPYHTKVLTIASGLQMPNGVAYYQGSLYVADLNRILRFDNIINHLTDPPKPQIVTENLPGKTHHGWRYIHFGPDGKLYIGIGAPCNICLSEDPRFASIMRMNPDGSQAEIYARGIRNTVGFDWDPVKHELWFTDNGRDWLGDNSPPDELNHAPRKDLHFGFPFCHGKSVSDPEFGKNHPCSAFTPPVLDLQAHVATLGTLFYTGKMFPAKYEQQLFIAEHGSWNRSKKVGYQVIFVDLKSSPPKAEPFITGWLQHENPWGRPVDLLMLPDGSLLISDDFANVIYRVTYEGK